jgi:hypothetical protein
MFLDGDEEALSLYKAGDRTSDCVVAYFRREGLEADKKCGACIRPATA